MTMDPTCPVCNLPENSWCRDVQGVIRPKCVSADCLEHATCGERCRDCDIEHLFLEMTCSGCGKLRLNEMGIAFYGEAAKCACQAPRPETQA